MAKKQNPKLSRIQEDMEPGTLSLEGFVADDDIAIERQIATDKSAVEESGVTTDQIAKRMRMLTRLGNDGIGGPVKVGKYKVTVDEHRGLISCPFKDGMKASKRNTKVVNTETGKELHWTDLNVHMIQHHCFFEGQHSQMRIEPAALISFLELEPENEPGDIPTLESLFEEDEE